ncbi:cytochrome c3 family protein [Desulfonema magnum]|uniref:Cytochrome c, class III family protein n=1 Tax=Desulfonema magnum TaxID=45655 RepID=A0A975GSF8_9BACT|nr:cytochrome c3 family protein [Desulfonema magnum]QTA91033.1 Putative cytochrome c, class III family protein [Desulfonema magnum]
MKKSTLLAILIIGIVTMFTAAAIQAGTAVQDVIKMENKAYAKHKKGIVEFSHKKHMEDYAKANPELYPNGCGECHHNDKNEPLKDLKIGDDVQNCIECHKIASVKPKGKDAPKLSKKEAVKEYHAEAIHANCKGCHKAFNEKSGKKTAPTSCTKCHPKNK